MKFLTKINRNYLLLFGAILFVLSISGYFLLKAIILKSTSESLLREETLIRKQISETKRIPELLPLIEVVQVSGQESSHQVFREVAIFNKEENETEYFTEYSNVIRVDSLSYLVKLRQENLENEDLALTIAATIFILLLASFIISYIITRKLNRTSWSAFEYNLKEIENFDFRDNKVFQLKHSDIEEFDRLNMVVNNLTAKLKKDYNSLKEFTENASHEIQSPLTIAALNLEEILQYDLSEELFRKVVTAINAIKRLSALNRNLLLLTKIENDQFAADQYINFNDLIKSKIDEFDLLFKEKNIKVSYVSESEFRTKINMHLAGILINNLMSNAVNHNINYGFINISVDQNAMVFCNSGEINNLTDKTVFNRFTKGNSTSSGLGLAIVKNICESNNLEIRYSKNELHCFTIKFKS